jgi:hypothetical protein
MASQCIVSEGRWTATTAFTLGPAFGEKELRDTSVSG